MAKEVNLLLQTLPRHMNVKQQELLAIRNTQLCPQGHLYLKDPDERGLSLTTAIQVTS